MYKTTSCCVGLLALVMGSTAMATEIGTPMDCTDLILAQGLSCAQSTAPGASTGFSANVSVMDNDGRILLRGTDSSEDNIRLVGTCGAIDLYKTALVYHLSDEGVRRPIVSVKQRCFNAGTGEYETINVGDMLFDAVQGMLVISFSSVNPNGGGAWVARIKGFTSLKSLMR
jgi:hypothetical protein